jgi:steroid delta-isomerase-like uncharacterized protein
MSSVPAETLTTATYNEEEIAMTTEQNKAIVRRYFEGGHAAELLSPDFVVHLPGAPVPQNRESFLQEMSLYDAAFSDSHAVVEDQIAEGDKVVTRVTWQGTHSSNFQGLSPTGKQIVMAGTVVQRIKDGKIVEHWPIFDSMGMMQQLGLIPPPQSNR